MELYHHGIKGQKWGVKHGPPYPLKQETSQRVQKQATTSKRKTASNTEQQGTKRRVTPSKAVQKNSEFVVGRIPKQEKRGLTDEQKKKLKTAGILLGSALAVAGVIVIAKKTGALDKGKALIEDALGRCGQTPIAKLSLKDKSIGDIKTISESVSESLEKTNPLRETTDGDNNCTSCSIAGIMRTMGIDVKARGFGGQAQNLGGLLEDSFENIKVLDGSARTFGKSPKDAAAMLVKRYGNNAKGVVNIKWKGSDIGHAFSWIIEDGKVNFLDFQNGQSGSQLYRYWKNIDQSGPLILAQLTDNLKIKPEGIQKAVNFTASIMEDGL